MARADRSVEENVEGDLFVDDTCIDCDACRTIAPQVFGDARGHSFVRSQPRSPEEAKRALMALVTCPAASIGSRSKRDLTEAIDALPEPIAEGVRFCGYASPDSYGALSYLLEREEGNVLVDSPRAAKPLLKRLDALGRVSMQFLTHRDDVADHAKFRAHFGLERVMHASDIGWGTQDVERKLAGDAPIQLAPDLLAIPVPGHTRGSCALLFRERWLFTGDHLWWEEDYGLAMGRGVCWYSWEEQVRSLVKLREYRFEGVFPGHGRRFVAKSAEHMRDELERLIARVS